MTTRRGAARARTHVELLGRAGFDTELLPAGALMRARSISADAAIAHGAAALPAALAAAGGLDRVAFDRGDGLLARLGALTREAANEALLHEVINRLRAGSPPSLRVAEREAHARRLREALLRRRRSGEAQALERAGELSAAVRAARDAPTRERLSGMLRALDPDWLPEVGRTAAASGSGGGRRILNQLEVSLPHAPSGYAYRSRTLMEAQRRIGYEPVAATRLGFPANRGTTRFELVEDSDGIPHHRFVIPGVRHYSGIPLDTQLQVGADLLCDLAVVDPPALLNAATPQVNGKVALAAGRRLGIPVAYDVRGFPELTWAAEADSGEAGELVELRRAAETRCMKAAAVVTCLSETMRAEIVGRGVPAESVHVVPHAVDLARFEHGDLEEDARRRLGLEGRFVVGYTTTLRDYEGVDVLLEAVAIARRSIPRIAALIVGDGPAAAALQDRVQALELADTAFLTGRVPQADVAAYQRAMDVFVVPRHDTALARVVAPLKPVEAMAAGACIAASDLPSLRELIGDGDAGALFPPADAAALASLLVELEHDPSRRAELGARARARAKKSHSLERLDSALARAISSVAS